MIDSRQRVWVAPYNNGIRCFAKDGALLASYTTRNSQLNNDVVLCMAERDGHIWIGTDGGGINVLDPETQEISVLEHIPGNNYSLPVNSILCLHNDVNNNMWAGSIRGGLINIREISMKTYTDAVPGNDAGLSDNTVLSLYQEFCIRRYLDWYRWRRLEQIKSRDGKIPALSGYMENQK